MNQPYIFESNKNSELGGSDAVIMLPDIYGQTDYSKRSVEEFADAFKKPVFMLDYFYLITNKVNNFTEVDREKAHSLMQNFKGDDFVTFFKKVLGEIKEVYPAITQFIVIGFCFGGRLAYIAGGEDRVCKVVSFYGGGPHTPNYIEDKTPIEYIISKRREGGLQVVSFFGTQDKSIPESDRQKIKEEFEKRNIVYESYEYNAGHAYFQEGRPNYNAPASQASLEVLQKVLNN